MRSLATILLVASAIVLVFWLTSGSPRTHPGALPGTTALRPAPAMPTPGPSPEVPTPPAEGDSGPTLVSTRGGLEGLCQERGVVGEALLNILRLTRGQDVRFLDRSFAQEHHRILTAWREDPSRQDRDLDLLVTAFQSIPDPGFRWALSWLFQLVPDDRLVEPLAALLPVDAWRVTDALAGVGTPAAVERLVALQPVMPDPATRSQATIRIARSGWEGALDHLDRTWNNLSLSAGERLVAVESLAEVRGDPWAMRLALDTALGPARPLGDLGERRADHPEADLRSGAVLAIMRRGDQDLARQLLRRADAPEADAAFKRMVDLHLGAYQGADISRLVLDRILRRGQVSLGEARYLERTVTRGDREVLESVLAMAGSDHVRQLLRAAIANAAIRE